VLVTAVALSLAAATTEAWRYRLWLLLFALYTRIGREEVLDNETRGMIRGVIIADQGYTTATCSAGSRPATGPWRTT